MVAGAQKQSAPPGEAAAPTAAGLVLSSLILGALVSNLNLSVANIALPGIGRHFDASQTQMNLVALGASLGLAMSVLYFGALGDRYGRKQLLLLGMVLTVPASLLSAYAPSVPVLIGARIFTGLAAGLAYPTTLALITALWGQGAARTKAIALWSGVSGGGAMIGPVLAGVMLERFWWGSVFLIALPPAIVAAVLVARSVPAHVNESSERVDHLGGVLSVVMVAALVLGLGTISAPGQLARSLALIALAAVLVVVFGRHQARTDSPLYDLTVARRVLFWVPAVAGMIVFGSLMGSTFIGQQFMQNVLKYPTSAAGLAILPSALGMVAVAPLSARLVNERGSRFTLLAGYAFVFAATVVMLIFWREGSHYWSVGLGYLLVGTGAGLAMTPASRCLTSSVPVRRVGMASGTGDLQRDLGGSVMQAILGSLLTAGYAAEFARLLGESPQAKQVSQATQTALTQSFTSAQDVAANYPQYATAIEQAARQSFLQGANLAYACAAITVLLGALMVVRLFPGHAGETELLAQYQAADAPPPSPESAS